MRRKSEARQKSEFAEQWDEEMEWDYIDVDAPAPGQRLVRMVLTSPSFWLLAFFVIVILTVRS